MGGVLRRRVLFWIDGGGVMVGSDRGGGNKGGLEGRGGPGGMLFSIEVIWRCCFGKRG